MALWPKNNNIQKLQIGNFALGNTFTWESTKMKDQRDSQKSEIFSCVLFLPASFLESFELGPVSCPNAQMIFFLSLKKLLLEKSKYNSVAED